MTATAKTDAQLDRAHVEGRVITSGLAHLALVLSGEDAGLRDELKSLTSNFGAFMGRLGDASTMACDAEREERGRVQPETGRRSGDRPAA